MKGWGDTFTEICLSDTHRGYLRPLYLCHGHLGSISLFFLTQTPTCNSDTTGYRSTVANVAHAHFKKVLSVFFLQQVYLEIFGCEVATAHAGHSRAFRCKGFLLGVHSSFSLSMCCLFFVVMLSFKRLP